MTLCEDVGDLPRRRYTTAAIVNVDTGIAKLNEARTRITPMGSVSVIYTTGNLAFKSRLILKKPNDALAIHTMP
ncbi:hypothetical protein M422DRAFT_27130 [Sphaerobolus stellatus SS14]|nr:hypothetical protein M422DRAFT_27130 [Sphaerobolus stellatus SS14]